LAHFDLRLLVCAALCGLTASGCTELASGSDLLEMEPRMLAGSAGSPPVEDPKWACLDGSERPSAVLLRPTVTFSLALNDPSTRSVPPGASVRACNRFDLECATPVLGPLELSADNLFHLSLPQGFDGFLEITSPAIIPSLYVFSRPLQTDLDDEFIVVSLATARGLAASGSVQLDPTLGLVAVRTRDCLGELTAGVRFSNDKGGTAFAFVDGLPVVGYDESNAEGLGGFVNVPLGTVVLQGQEAMSGRVSGTATVLMRAGWIAIVELDPRPR
jgi:hypothetical protein